MEGRRQAENPEAENEGAKGVSPAYDDAGYSNSPHGPRGIKKAPATVGVTGEGHKMSADGLSEDLTNLIENALRCDVPVADIVYALRMELQGLSEMTGDDRGEER